MRTSEVGSQVVVVVVEQLVEQLGHVVPQPVRPLGHRLAQDERLDPAARRAAPVRS